MEQEKSFPTQAKILDFIRFAGSPVTKREICHAFNIKGDDRILLKQILRKLENNGDISKSSGQKYCLAEALPQVCILRIDEPDEQGDLSAYPENRPHNDTKIIVTDTSKSPVSGDRILANLSLVNNENEEKPYYEATIIRKLNQAHQTVIGMIKNTGKNRLVVAPVDKKIRDEYPIAPHDYDKVTENMIVKAGILHSRTQKSRAKILEVIYDSTGQNAISIISMTERGITKEFPEQVIKECTNLTVPKIDSSREDLTSIPLVTIDGEDARDFDDAVYAKKEDGGYYLIVAIADVAHYVKSGSATDQEAFRRGNSTYFPDCVVPMLPEQLSNDLCSLVPHKNRASLAVHMKINNEGKLLHYKFTRAVIKSAARLTYNQVQAIHEGTEEIPHDAKINKEHIESLYGAYSVLAQERIKRNALEIDMPEYKIKFDVAGKMCDVEKVIRLDSHKLVEEFMITANVAAATALENENFACIYRIHDTPSQSKLDSASSFIGNFGIKLPKGKNPSTKSLNAILNQAKTHSYGYILSEIVLRAQSQAFYRPDNRGHYGLALQKYAHFTSPIRRYADLVVHRALIKALKLGKNGITEHETARLDEICEHISSTERNSMDAERSANDRFTSLWLSDRAGEIFNGTVRSVTSFGLFVQLDNLATDGLVPIRTLGDDYFVHDEQNQALIGRKTRIIYRTGAKIKVRLKESDPITGSKILEVIGNKGADIPDIPLIKTNQRTQQEENKNRRNNKKHRSKGKKNHKKRRALP